MCGADEEAAARWLVGLDRRQLLTVAGAGVGALLVPGPVAAATGASFTGQAPVLSALHVHGPNDEQTASVELQLHRAAQAGYRLVVPTPHNFRALAEGYLTSLAEANLLPSSTGAAVQRLARHEGESVRLLVEAAGGGPATIALVVETGQAQNRLRTSIAGTTLQLGFGSGRVGAGGRFEVVVTLSDRPGGPRSLRYRFGAGTGRGLEQGGAVGVVAGPLPVAGGQVTLDPVGDSRILWPADVPTDSGLVMLGVEATSPGPGVVVDVLVSAVQIVRTAHDAASVSAQMRTAVDAALRHLPALSVQPSVEVSSKNLAWPHLNLFGVPQRLPSSAAVPDAERAAWLRALVASVRADGGVVSLNHPYGVTGTDGTVVTGAVQAAQRRQVAAALLADDAYGCEVLEVGYALRGGHPITSHLALWDVLSRRGRYFTGSGVNDDHLGGDWRLLGNGYGQALLLDGAPISLTSVAKALRAGRAFLVHPTRWPHAALDLRVDGFLPMGGADVSSRPTRRLELAAAHLPPGAEVRVVQGVVDRVGLDPLVQTVARWTATQFGPGGSGVRALDLDTGRSSFVRAEVRQAGTVIGSSNPVYLLREPGPVQIPSARRYR